MQKGDSFLLSHNTANRPMMATIVSLQGFTVVMEGIYRGSKKRFHEHVSRFEGKSPRWVKQLSLFENKTESNLSKKHLK